VEHAVEPLDRLLAVEAIRKLKATYWFATDVKDWPVLASLFAEDGVFDMRGDPFRSPAEALAALPPVEQAIAEGDPAVLVGNEAIARFISGLVDRWTTVHIGGEPIIDITGPADATGIWPLFDYVDDGSHSVKAYGHYFERYRRTGDSWRIQYVVLTRLRVDGTPPWAIKE